MDAGLELPELIEALASRPTPCRRVCVNAIIVAQVEMRVGGGQSLDQLGLAR